MRGKTKNSPILGVDGAPVGGDPRILLPGGVPEPRPSALHLGVGDDGVIIAIRNGALTIEDQDRITSTNLPWEAVPSLLNNLVRLMAYHYPRPQEDEDEVIDVVEETPQA